jgi:hypothetical protein
MYFCLKELGASRIASLIGSIIFLNCGFFVGNTEHFAHINCLAYLPLALLAVNKLTKAPSLIKLSIGSLVIPLIAFSGYPTMLIQSIYLMFMFGVLRILFIDNNSGKSALKRIIYLVSFFLLGICLSAILLLPVFENAGLSVRASGVPIESIKANSFPIDYLGGLWFPFLATMDFLPFHVEITLRNVSIGIIGLFMALFFLFTNKSKLKWSLLTLICLALIMMLGMNTVLYKVIIKIVPFLKYVRHPAIDYRATFLLLLCLCVGIGADGIFLIKKRGSRKLFFSLGLFIAIGFYIAVYLSTKHKIDILTLSTLRYPGILLSFLFVLAIIFLCRVLTKKYFAVLLILFCVIDSAYWTKVNFATVAGHISNKAREGINYSERNRNTSVSAPVSFTRREGVYPISLRDNFACYFKYFTNTGYDPFILKRYDDLMRSPRRGIVTDNFRVKPIYTIKILRDEKSVLKCINDGEDLTKVALINETDVENVGVINELKRILPSDHTAFDAKIIRYTPNEIEYKISTDAPVLVFFNEIYYPGWQLYYGKKRMPLFNINHTFRGTYLEPGEYRLKMFFSPISFKIGLAITFLAIIFVCCSIFLWFAKRNVKPPIIRSS